MKTLIIDGLNLFVSCFVVNPTMDANGEHVGGIMGFLMALNKQIREIKPDEVIIAWDGDGGSLRRRSLYKDYKAGRKPKLNRQYGYDNVEEQLESFRKQVNRLDTYLEMLPIRTIRIAGIEADDVIAFICKYLREDTKKIIMSTDKDFYQLLDINTIIYSPRKKKFVTSVDLKEDLSILPENYIFMKALCGDGSDNIKGINGIGEKTTVKMFPFLLDSETNLQALFEHAEKNSDGKNRFSRVLQEREVVIKNVKLMQLSSPEISSRSVATIRGALEGTDFTYKPSEMKINLVTEGLSVKAYDFFINFKAQKHRSVRTFGGDR